MKKINKTSVSLSLVNAVLMVFVSFFLLNQSVVREDERTLIVNTTERKAKFLDIDIEGLVEGIAPADTTAVAADSTQIIEEEPIFDEDEEQEIDWLDINSYLFLNVAYDKELIDYKDDNGFVIGEEPITNRKKLTELFQFLNKYPDAYKYVICDVFLSGDSKHDAALEAELKKAKNVIFPYHQNPDSTLDLPKFDSLHLGFADYTATDDYFVKYKLSYGDSLETIPLVMFRDLDGGEMTKDGFFHYVNGQRAFDNFIVNLRIPGIPDNKIQNLGEFLSFVNPDMGGDDFGDDWDDAGGDDMGWDDAGTETTDTGGDDMGWDDAGTETTDTGGDDMDWDDAGTETTDTSGDDMDWDDAGTEATEGEDDMGWDDAGSDTTLGADDDFNRTFIENRIIVIGDFQSDADMHTTVFGEMPGPLLLLNTYLALKFGDNIIPNALFPILFITFFLLSLIVFQPESLFDKWVAYLLTFVVKLVEYLRLQLSKIGPDHKLKEKYSEKLLENVDTKFTDYITGIFTYAFILTTVSSLSYFLFNIHLNILYLTVYIYGLQKLVAFVYKKIAKRKEKREAKLTGTATEA